MRLTLRTLLAYMDEILEPSDREELAKKVESSDFALDLIHRTKDTMRRLRLSAPQVVGTGMGLDPNTVAEYLDNVLPPDSVADFERICLESDVHLAEVASAHHVLTMVLGEPAEVDPIARQRMYAIPGEAERRRHLRIEPAHLAPAAVHEPAAVAPPPHVFPAPSRAPRAQTQTDVVPDYLRASSWTSHGGLLAACAAVLLLAVTALLTSGLTGWFGGEKLASAPAVEEAATTSDIIEPPTVPPLEPPAVPTPIAESEASDESATIVEEPAAAAQGSLASPPQLMMPSLNAPTVQTPPQDSAMATVTQAEVPATDSTGNESVDVYSGTPAGPAAENTAAISPETTTNIAPAPVETPAVPSPADLASATMTAIDPVAGAAPALDATSDTESVAAADTADRAAGEESIAEANKKPAELGTYLDSKNVLLRFDSSAGAWFRLPARATIHSGDKLLALPAFFPKLTLTSGLHLKLVGGTSITFGSTQNGANEPSLDVAYGKVVIVNTADDENGLRLTIGSDSADVRLGRGATLAVDVMRKYAPGQDPRESPSPIVAQIYVRAGEVVWNDASGSQTITSPGHWSLEGQSPWAVSNDVAIPDWIDQEPVEQRSEQLFGAPEVDRSLETGRPVDEQLLELYQGSRRREVKSLVARSCVYTGLFVPFVEALRDSDQKSAWKMHIDTLRLAMAHGPESAENIYQTLVEQRGEAAAADLYEMLCGYGAEQIGTPEEFQTGLGARLVDWMDNDSLDYRVLAIQDMAEITGMKLMQNPAGAPAERARGVRIWRQRLKDGEIAPMKH